MKYRYISEIVTRPLMAPVELEEVIEKAESAKKQYGDPEFGHQYYSEVSDYFRSLARQSDSSESVLKYNALAKRAGAIFQMLLNQAWDRLARNQPRYRHF